MVDDIEVDKKVIKQAHIVIDYLEKNVPIDVLKRISTKDAKMILPKGTSYS